MKPRSPRAGHRVGCCRGWIILLVLWQVTAHGTSPPGWTDSRLGVRDGLVIWLDAGSIAAARQSSGMPGLVDGDRLERWPDGSGQARDFTQTEPADQPHLVELGQWWSVRFDGQSDHLRWVGGPTTARAITVWMVAAPHANPGDYRGLLAAGAANRRDYESGFNIGLGRLPGTRLERLNVEGRGFGGEQNLLREASPLGSPHRLAVTVDPEQRRVTLTVDGRPHGERPFDPSELALEQFTLGARFFNNGPGDQHVHGPIQADILEVLVYDRVLGGEEFQSIGDYLETKYRGLAEPLSRQRPVANAGVPLIKASDPPLVQMLQAGFSVRELPLSLSNINSVRFREDGRLMTLGYNGDLHLLSDTDGDGLEDRAELFWKNEGSLRGPIGLLLTPPDSPHGRGALVPSKGRLSLIADSDGDDKADREIVVASGWQEIPQNVDAVGIAMDAEGWLYFGLGTANYANAYLIDEAGQAGYRLDSDRGTIQRVSPDFQRRETVCTGIRFPIAMAFHRNGDLFCSEQEGATWLANGNPFDELLHIQPGRHYGFPPRHPRHNPSVIDEPSVFDYGPQHQSTCGMVFNEPVHGGPVFGPPSWAGDAIVCGESRGKIWRTRLVKTSAGYVAATQLLACLQMLTVDACVAPDGDLVVACHSGPPDWGTGPTGIGKLFRIEMTEPAAPRPVAVWAESPHEIRLAMDRPVDPLTFRRAAEQVRVEYGEFVRAGDRFENLVPPYEVVARQATSPRFELPVASVSLTPDLRTLLIGTAAMSSSTHYAVSLPRAVQPRSGSDPGRSELAQHGQTDVDFTLGGVQVLWEASGDSELASSESAAPAANRSSWIPHLDLGVARAFTAGSITHDNLWAAIEQPGMLTLRTRLDLHDILRPAVQPGSTLDHRWPAETVTVTFRAPVGLEVEARRSEGSVEVAVDHGVATLICGGESLQPVDVTIRLPTGGATAAELAVTVHTNEDARPRPLPLSRILLPWAVGGGAQPPDTAPRKLAELEGGNWGLGRRVFHSQAAGCFKCHAMGGMGAVIGPDLGNLVHRDYASVLRDIVQPSFAINPDFIGHNVVTEDGKVLTGVLRSEAGQLLLGDTEGRVTRLDRRVIESMQPASVSVMPEGLHAKLTPQQLRDLMTFLLLPAPQMPQDVPLEAPPVRSRAELAAVLSGSAVPPDQWRPLRIVLVAGEKDHGPGEHDYPAWQVQWGQLLSAAPEVTVDAAWGFPSDAQLAEADVLVFFQKGAWDDQRQARLDAFQRRGGGAVYLHWAVNGGERAADFSHRIGLSSRGGSISYRHGPLQLDMHNTDHPILRNFDALQLYDESYWKLTGDVEHVTLLASSVEEGQPHPQLWTYEKDGGRVFVSIPGHYSWTFDDPLFRVLLLRGIAWTAQEPIDRFNELAPLGARLSR